MKSGAAASDASQRIVAVVAADIVAGVEVARAGAVLSRKDPFVLVVGDAVDDVAHSG